MAVTAPASATRFDETPPPRRGWWRHRYLLGLLLVTAVGGALRFYRLDRPLIWFDEAMTFCRTCGTWEQMFDRLSTDGFMPLHYMLYWWLGRRVTMTPWWMRAIPAACGTLMIPAVYFLARQMTSRGVALAAACLAAGSAYLLAFSRDAKMYMPTWLMVCISVAALLWWMRGRRWWHWLIGPPLWLASGSAAVWLSAGALVVIGLQPLLAPTAVRGRWWTIGLKLAVFAAGMAVIAAGPWWYFNHISRWNQRTGFIPAAQTPGRVSEGPSPGPQASPQTRPEASPSWKHSGIAWIVRFQEGRDSPAMLRHTAGTFAVGWEWPLPKEANETHGKEFVIPRWTIDGFTRFLIGFGAALAIGALPWPHRVWRRRRASIADEPERPVPRWLMLFWLSVWLVLPTYGYYCRSVDGFVTPWYWLGWLWETTGRPWGIASGLAAWAMIGLAWRRGSWWREQAAALLKVLAVGAVVLILCWGVYLSVYHLVYLPARDRPRFEWLNVWWPRYLGVVLPAALVAAAALIMRLPTRPLRLLVLVAVLSVNLAHALARIELDTDPPIDRVARDLWDDQQGDGHREVLLVSYTVQDGTPRTWPVSDLIRRADGTYYWCLIGGVRSSPKEFEFGQVNPRPRPPRAVLPADLASAPRDRPRVQRVIAWEHWPAAGPPPDDRDRTGEALGDGWRLADVHAQRVYQHWFVISREWNWQRRDWLVRREYVRQRPDAKSRQDN